MCGGFPASLDNTMGVNGTKVPPPVSRQDPAGLSALPVPLLVYPLQKKVVDGHRSDMDCVMVMIVVKMLNILQFIPYPKDKSYRFGSSPCQTKHCQ